MGTLLSPSSGWGLQSAQFTNPSYIQRVAGDSPQSGDSIGFDISSGNGLILAFSGTYTGLTVSHEQTLDGTGATGWFPVAAQISSAVGSTVPVLDGSTSGSCYIFPVYGARHRVRVTALSTGTVTMRASLIPQLPDLLSASAPAVAPTGTTQTVYNRSAGTDRSITASVTSQQLMAANATRSKMIIKNDTAIAVFINIGATAVAAAGSGNYQIAANGGYMELDGTTSAINIIAVSGTPAISAREF